MRMQGDEWHEDADARLRQLIGQGMSFKAVADEMGRTYRSIKARAGRIGIRVKKDYDQVLDEFAELLAKGVDPDHAAVRMGYKPKYGYQLLTKIRRRLGWQAR